MVGWYVPPLHSTLSRKKKMTHVCTSHLDTHPRLQFPFVPLRLEHAQATAATDVLLRVRRSQPPMWSPPAIRSSIRQNSWQRRQLKRSAPSPMTDRAGHKGAQQRWRGHPGCQTVSPLFSERQRPMGDAVVASANEFSSSSIARRAQQWRLGQIEGGSVPSSAEAHSSIPVARINTAPLQSPSEAIASSSAGKEEQSHWRRAGVVVGAFSPLDVVGARRRRLPQAVYIHSCPGTHYADYSVRLDLVWCLLCPFVRQSPEMNNAVQTWWARDPATFLLSCLLAVNSYWIVADAGWFQPSPHTAVIGKKETAICHLLREWVNPRLRDRVTGTIFYGLMFYRSISKWH
jgi:hypothetical protein